MRQLLQFWLRSGWDVSRDYRAAWFASTGLVAVVMTAGLLAQSVDSPADESADRDAAVVSEAQPPVDADETDDVGEDTPTSDEPAGKSADDGDDNDVSQSGLEALDRATLLKLNADSMGDLEEVVDLCDEAIARGISDENRAYAEDLMTATLYEQASRLSRLIFDQQPPDPRWARIRQACLAKLQRAIEVRKQMGGAHLLIARLQTLPNGDRDAAVQAVDQAIRLLTDQTDMLSQAYQTRAALSQDPEKILPDLNRAVELNPRNLDAWRARGVFHLARGDAEQALQDLEQLLTQDPEDLIAHQAIAQTLRQLKQYDKAMEHLDQVIKANPESSLAYNLRAKVAEDQGNVEVAVQNLSDAIRVNPNDLGAILTRARLRADQQQYDLARSDIDRALRIQPRLPQALILRSLVSAGQGKFGEAIGDLEDLADQSGENSRFALELKMQIASYYEMDQRPRKAIETYTELLASMDATTSPGETDVSPSDADDAEVGSDDQLETAFSQALLHRRRGDAYLSIGNHQMAVEDYQAALKLKPDDSGVLNNLAWVLATSPREGVRDGARAVELATKACQVTDFKQAHILSTLAAAYAESGQFDKAIEWSQKAVDLDADQPQLAKELEAYQRAEPWRELQEVAENPEELVVPGAPVDDQTVPKNTLDDSSAEN